MSEFDQFSFLVIDFGFSHSLFSLLCFQSKIFFEFFFAIRIRAFGRSHQRFFWSMMDFLGLKKVILLKIVWNGHLKWFWVDFWVGIYFWGSWIERVQIGIVWSRLDTAWTRIFNWSGRFFVNFGKSFWLVFTRKRHNTTSFWIFQFWPRAQIWAWRWTRRSCQFVIAARFTSRTMPTIHGTITILKLNLLIWPYLTP